ncbi:TonB-dependent siderophore receptor [Methylosinus sp. Ce-a6]|uniref:TonB-dependent receptor family protein n=1 Tax=Methylosinus sp. Ce-a6 TaxID=2172005 RepID=UPI001914EA8A|nr:TonB-dependent siderophore receptor [Methylosinus sp. Ce-a6]
MHRSSCTAPRGVAPLLLLAAASVALPSRAQEALPTIEVNGWLGDETEKAVKTYPGARTVLGKKELRRSGARNIEDALRQVPGVRVQDETGTGLLPNIGVRGLNPARSERAQVLVDGIPLALGPYTGTGLSLFPVTMETIDRIDVVRGGAAVHYGPNNVGGVINMITKPIPAKPTFVARERLTIGGDTGNVLTDSYVQTGGFVTPEFGWQLQFNALAGNSWRAHSATRAYNLLLNSHWLVSDRDEIKGSLQYYSARADLPGALTPLAYQRDRTRSQRPFDAFAGDTWRGSLNYSHFFDDGEFTWTSFGHISDRAFTFSEPFDPALRPTTVSTSPRDFHVFGTEPRYTLLLDTGPVSHKLILGGRYVLEDVDFVVDRLTLKTGRTARQRDWRFDTDAFAGYASDTLGFFEGRLKITPGVRYEHVGTVYRDRLSLTGQSFRNVATEWLPGVDVGVEATDWLFAFANAHRSLRPPQVAQVTRGGVVGAEVAWNYEAGVRLTPLPEVEATVTGFRIDFTNQIEFDRTTQLFRNLGATEHNGVELEAGWRPEQLLPGVSFKAGYTYVDARQRSGVFAGKEVPFASPHQISLRGGYTIDGYDLGVTGYYQSAAFTDAANTVAEDVTGTVGKIPGYWLWNMQLTKELEFAEPGLPSRIVMAATINNIFDQDYYFRGVDTSPVGRVPGPGRSFLISLKAEF